MRALPLVSQSEIMARASSVLTNILRAAGFSEKQVIRAKRAGPDAQPAAAAPQSDALIGLARRSICASNIVKAIVRSMQMKLNLEGLCVCMSAAVWLCVFSVA